MGEAITLKVRGQPHWASPVAFRAVGRPVALPPYLIDREALIIEDPLPALDVASIAEGAADILSLDLLLQDANDDVALRAFLGHCRIYALVEDLYLLSVLISKKRQTSYHELLTIIIRHFHNTLWISFILKCQ